MTSHLEEKQVRVLEGDLPVDVRPHSGWSEERSVWTGHGDEAQPIKFGTTAVGTYRAEEEYGAERQWSKGRIIGINVARGLALFGMFSVHTLDPWNEEAERVTVLWMMTAGNAAALFAVLAGVGIALSTGGSKGLRPERRIHARVQLFVRALLILFIGLLSNLWLDPPVFNILPYYAVLFLLASLFLGVRKRTLCTWALLIMLAGPIAQYFVRSAEPYERILSPVPADLISNPADVLGTLLFTGTYPVTTWSAYMLVGLALGRMQLNRIQVQRGLFGFGAFAAVSGWLMSRMAVNFLGGYEGMLYSEVRITQEMVEAFLTEGPDEDLPTSSFWWLTVAGPHTNTFFSLLLSTGVAVSVLGATLLICRVFPRLLWPLAAAGSMTLTLYVCHMAFLHFYAIGDYSTDQELNLALAIQILGVLIISGLWSLLFRRGPLEWLVGELSKRIADPRRKSAETGGALKSGSRGMTGSGWGRHRAVSGRHSM
ncbi:heparan-alpha-glucosaminide N-acetyltransferase domain-containing protein [Corynebacterium crudilactis]|uniref:Heparan-alpha-glucosaminide N-acetyltransferase catalytic domain-containing protein n=1 Tax=Corynebacterium crudilactis TaxID=1652495 RepID=A0A172QQL6_9CORY|nr:heparan-alpha-glucosaminide N-acetyltransferase domain-containing protein [Corynebacterium crudilactis]ANE02985.1 hypothetical protein ccrud_01300 [Corynebacterium crudilactis]